MTFRRTSAGLRRGAAELAAIVALCLMGALAASCSGGRFPVCKSNEECAAKGGDTGKVCYNLKCVQCAYDGDCPSGKACNRQLNECQSILSSSPPEEGSDASPSWEPTTWDECAKRCKDPACITACDQKFKK